MSTTPDRHVVLLGPGHTNIQVLCQWRRHPIPGAQLTCIADHACATYSGMLPAVLAGTYPDARMEIDLARLCADSGARLIVGNVTGLDGPSRALTMRDHPPVPFDVLSVGIGSVPSFDGVEVSDDAAPVSIKPMQTFLARLASAMRAAASDRAGAPIRVAIVGGGAAGAEIACALPRYATRLPGWTASIEQTMVAADPRLLPDAAASTSQRVARALSRCGVQTRLGRRVVQVRPRQLRLDDGSGVEADVVLWATGAAPPALLAVLGLPTDERGFLLTRDTLQSTSGLPIFGVGDTGSIEGGRVPKAGVFAVRQGPVLWDNIGRLLADRPLTPYVPQRDFLKLLNTGDGRAIAEWKGLSFEGAWCWRLKDAIDTRFMRTLWPARR